MRFTVDRESIKSKQPAKGASLP